MKKIMCLLLATASACFQGCAGNPTGKLSGKVTFNKKPVQIGTVLVVSADGKSNVTGYIQDGSFTVDHAPVGTVSLALHIPKLPEGDFKDNKAPKLPPEVDRAMKRAALEQSKEGQIPPKAGFNPDVASAEQLAGLKALQGVPERFFNARTSGLKTTIQADQE